MRRTFLIPLFCAYAAVAVAAPAATVPDFATARATAKKQNRPIVILADGSGYAPDSKPVREAYLAAAPRIAAVVSIHDYAPGRPPDAPKGPEPMPWNLPAILILDSEGRLFASAEGLRTGNIGAALAAIPGRIGALKRRDELLAKAEKQKGPERARSLGAALDLMSPAAALARKDLIDDIRKADTHDATGYVFRYTFDAAGWQERVVGKAIKEKTTAPVLAEISGLLGKPGISATQRQLLLAGRFRILNATGEQAAALATLRDMSALAPTSDMGRGAAGYLAQLSEPVKLAGLFWRPADNRPRFTPMLADVSAFVKGPGTYEIEFRHTSGHTRFRKVALLSGGATLADDDNPKENRKVTLVVKRAPSGAVTLSAESQGSGWFDGAGEIVVTKR